MKYNNDKSRDYTRPELPAGDGQPAVDPSVAAAFGKDSNSLLGKIPGISLFFFLFFLLLFLSLGGLDASGNPGFGGLSILKNKSFSFTVKSFFIFRCHLFIEHDVFFPQCCNSNRNKRIGIELLTVVAF